MVLHVRTSGLRWHEYAAHKRGARRSVDEESGRVGAVHGALGREWIVETPKFSSGFTELVWLVLLNFFAFASSFASIQNYQHQYHTTWLTLKRHTDLVQSDLSSQQISLALSLRQLQSLWFFMYNKHWTVVLQTPVFNGFGLLFLLLVRCIGHSPREETTMGDDA